MHTASTVIAVTLLLFSCSYLSNALQCYKCETTKDKGDKRYSAACIKPSKGQAQAKEQPEAPLKLQTCPKPEPDSRTKVFCFKNTDEELAGGYYIQRGCHGTTHYKEPTCVEGRVKGYEDLSGKTCLCDKDLCNGEGSHGSPSALLSSPQLWFIAQFPAVLRFLGLVSI